MSASDIVLENLSRVDDSKSSPESKEPASESLANLEPTTPVSALGATQASGNANPNSNQDANRRVSVRVFGKRKGDVNF